MRKLFTICLLQKGGEILLGFKKIGFGQGRWNGFGGKVNEGEDVEAAARRETKEENGLDTITLEKMGILEFRFTNNPEFILETHIFRCVDFEGEIIESDEMVSKWFKVSEIPYDKMWDDDKYWLPLFLEGKKFKGKFLFDDNDKVSSKEINVVNSL